jgi:hypothetical protein
VDEFPPIFPATHVTIRQVGDEVISVFAVQDGLASETLAVAVVMTRKTVDRIRDVLQGLVERSPALQKAQEQKAPLTDIEGPYVPFEPPSRASGLTMSVAEEHDLVTLAFVNIDTERTMRERAKVTDAAIDAVAVQSLGPRISLSASTFLGWAEKVLK